MTATVKCDTIKEINSTTPNLTLDSSGNVTVGNNLTVTGTTTQTGAQTFSSNVTMSGVGARFLGDFTNATVTNRVSFQTSTTNGSTGIYALPNGSSTAASWQATNNADPTNASKVLIATNGSTDVQLVSGRNGSGTYLPLSFYTNNTQNAQLDTSGNLTTVGTVNMGSSFLRNRIINGAMQIDQRNAGASQTVNTSGSYTVDRFFVQPGGANVTTQRVAGTGQNQYTFRITGAASVTSCYVQQKIEQLNSYDLAGQSVTVSFTASSSTLTSITCYLDYATAGADNWSTFTTNNTNVITINSTPTRYSFTTTLSASATNGIRFIFNLGAFTSGTFDITGVQLEVGSIATPFERRQYGQELALCQRYCLVDTNVNNPYRWFAVGFPNSTSNLYAGRMFPVPMRVSPAITFSAINVFIADGGNVINSTNMTDTGISSTMLGRITMTTAGSLTVGGCYWVGSDGSSSLRSITYSSEL